MARFALTPDPAMVLRDDGMYIPVNVAGNRESDDYAAWLAAGGVPDPAPPRPGPYLTGQDIIDGMSPAQAQAAAVDPRDLLRIQGRHAADTVKSKVARVEKALGLPAGALAAQATPTGGL